MSQSNDNNDNMVPPAALKAAGMLILFSLLLVIAVRAGLLAPTTPASELRRAAAVAPTAERLLRFSDHPDGTVRVTEAANGDVVAVVGREGGGFIRGVLRGLARERRQHRIGAAPPFRLTLWADGALALTDTATGRVIELNGFGPDNRATFMRLMRNS
jgi:putative photosynthetic complex assembly protein